MGEGYYITLFSPSDVTAFHRILTDSPLKRLLKFPGLLSNEMKIMLGIFYALNKLRIHNLFPLKCSRDMPVF